MSDDDFYDIEPEPTVTVTQLMQQLKFAQDKCERETNAIRVEYSRVLHAAVMGKSAAEHRLAAVCKERDRLQIEFKEAAAQAERSRQKVALVQQQMELVIPPRDAEIEHLEAERNHLREGVAWAYQLAGVVDCDVEVLDNLSALSVGKPAPHEWKAAYPSVIEERDRLREALVKAAIPLEVIAAQCADYPYTELSMDLQEQICNETVMEIRSALSLARGERKEE